MTRKRLRDQQPRGAKQVSEITPRTINVRYGRLHSDPYADSRNGASIDRDRILISYEFRRLAGVTQVTSASEGIHFRNRLTHTIEVARITREIAITLIASGDKRLITEIGGIDVDVAETAALAHDLGHPPFGHIGEEELDRLLVSLGVADGYEGNAQSFRIVTKLAREFSPFGGFNFTRATLNAILKYPWLRQTTGYANRKFGAYGTESAEFEFARQDQVPRRRSVEAEIMDWADDVAYALDDLEDFVRAGLIPLEHLDAYSEDLIAGVNAQLGGSLNVSFREIVDLTKKMFSAFAITWAFDKKFDGSTEHTLKLRSFIRAMRDRYMSVLRLVSPQSENDAVVRVDPQFKLEMAILKQLTRHFVIGKAALLTMQHGLSRILRELFQILLDDAMEHGRILPPPVKEAIARDSAVGLTAMRLQRARPIADWISGISEMELIRLCSRLTGHTPGSVLDRIY